MPPFSARSAQRPLRIDAGLLARPPFDRLSLRGDVVPAEESSMMKTASRALVFGLMLLVHGLAAASESAAAPAVPGLSFRFEKVAEGVYCAIGSGVPYFVANSVVIVSADGVLVVDSGPGPNEAFALRNAIRTLTDKPVRYVIDTHFHFDHALGEQAFPEAVIIAHEATRKNLGPDVLGGSTLAANMAGMADRIKKMTQQAEQETDAKRSELLTERAALEAYYQELSALKLEGPQLTFRDGLTLWLGTREVRVLHLGRGHSAGDIVVYLPQERIVCTGDLFNGYMGYMGDAYVDEWAETLGRLAALDFDTVIAGHGEPFKGKDAIAPVQACLRDIWRQAVELKQAGVSPDDAAQKIDLRAYASRFPRFAQVGFEPLALRRIYAVIDERAAAKP
jgi:cyclase